MITICLATYNGEKYLAQQIDSILKQTFTDWILLIHDDNSDDKTIQIIEKYIKKCPQKIKYIDDDISYGSASGNFSFLLNETNSEYIMFCDQDDIWLKNKIEDTFYEMKELEKKYLQSKALMVFSDLELVDENLKQIHKSFLKHQKLDPKITISLNKILAQNVVSGCTIMINKEAKKIVSPINTNDFIHDHWMAINICKFGVISFVDKSLLLYRQHNLNQVGSVELNFKYFLSKTYNFINSLNRYKSIGFDVNISKVIFWKIFLNTKRIFS